MHLQEVSFDHVAKIFVKFYPLTTFCLLIEQSTFILLGACERALILPTSAGEASPPPVLRRTCRCSIPHSARKLQNPHLLTKLHAS